MASNVKSIALIANSMREQTLTRLQVELDRPIGTRQPVMPVIQLAHGLRLALSMEVSGLAIFVARVWPPARPAFAEDEEAIQRFVGEMRAPADALVNTDYTANDTRYYAWYPKEPHRTADAVRAVRSQLDAVRASHEPKQE